MRPLFVVDRDRQKLKITKSDIKRLRDDGLAFSELLQTGKVSQSPLSSFSLLRPTHPPVLSLSS